MQRRRARRRWRRRRSCIRARPVLLQRAHDLRHGGALLADGDIDAVELGALVGAGVDGLLVQDGVDGHGGFAGLAVADDQLPLATADGDQGVDGLQARLHRLMHRLARDDAWRLHVHPATLGHVGERALAVDGFAERIDHAAEEAPAHRHVHDFGEAAHFVAFLDLLVLAKDHDTDVVALQVQGHALHAGFREFDHLPGLDLIQAIDAGDAVAHAQHLADVGDVGFLAEAGDLGFQDGRDFGGADVHILRSLKGELELIEPRLQRGIEQAGANPHLHAAEDRRVDAGGDFGVFAQRLTQRGGDALLLGGGQFNSGGHFGGDGAAMGGGETLERRRYSWNGRGAGVGG